MIGRLKNHKTFSQTLSLGLVAIFMALSSAQAFASSGTSLMQTAPVKNPGEFEIKLQSDIIFNSGGGLNLSPHLVTGVVEQLIDVDLYFGTGKTGFLIGGLGKYNLLPDIEGQIGLSFLGGFTFTNDESVSSGILTLGALASKELQADFGTLTPYVGFQPEFLIGGSDSTFMMSLQLGSQIKPQETGPWYFYSEFGISLHKSLFMLALGAAYPF